MRPICTFWTLAAIAVQWCILANDASAQAVVRGPYGGFAVFEPQEVDPGDAKERLLLLAPGGPMIVELEITIDGKPFRTEREAMIDELLKVGDHDQDGSITWDEILKNPPKFLGNLVYYANNEQARNQVIKANDKDEDGKLDRYEARLLLASAYAGPTFSMLNNSYNQSVSPDVFALLDEDKNDVLSAEEMAKAAERLASRDRDGNDIVDAMELGGAGGAFGGAVRGVGAGMRQTLPLLGMIGRSLNPDEAHAALLSRYGADNKLPVEKFTLMPALARRLDANKNGQIEKDELAALNEITPHVQLRASFGDTAQDAAPLELVSVLNDAGEKIMAEPSGKGGVSVALAGMRLEFVGGNINYGGFNYQQTAQAMLNQYDADKNGYLEEKELPDNVAAYMKQQFKAWDADEDGKVFVEEIKKSYELQTRPQNYRASVAAADMGGSLFSAMDTSGDSRLGLREMRTAAERLKTFDKDGDGAVGRAEVPTTIRFAVARGGFAYSLLPNRSGFTYGGQGGFVVGGGRPQPAKADPLEWFSRMDTNGDGDVTLKEFPGEPEQFKALDANGDGFIERKEAEAAGK